MLCIVKLYILGFLDSLGIEFVEDDTIDDVAEKVLGTSEETTDQEVAKPKVSKSSSRLSDYSKEDLIVFMMVLIFGAIGGYAYSNLLKKDKSQPMCTMPHYPFMPSQHSEKHEPVKEVKHSKSVEKHHKHRSTMRHGYYEDENGDLVLDPPTVRTNWVIDFGTDGSIMDAYQIPDSDQVI
jgi:hypothetical protein